MPSSEKFSYATGRHGNTFLWGGGGGNFKINSENNSVINYMVR